MAGTIRFGAFELDSNSGELRKSGLKIHLREQPFRILTMLLERPGEIITREEIQKILWPNDTVVEFEHSINAAIKSLRAALGDDADNPCFVETLPRRGYRFIAPVDGAVAALRRPTRSPPRARSCRTTQPMVGAGSPRRLPALGRPQGSPLQRVVMKCLAKDPDDRWQSAADLRDELKWIKVGLALVACATGYNPALHASPLHPMVALRYE